VNSESETDTPVIVGGGRWFFELAAVDMTLAPVFEGVIRFAGSDDIGLAEVKVDAVEVCGILGT
jgi:hypothetical protein